MTNYVYNVYRDAPTSQIEDWPIQEKQWRRLGDEIGARREFLPLTIKALYVVGLILASCRSVSLLLSGDLLISTTYYPAYMVFSSSVELLGRCISGNRTTSKSTIDLQTGFRWLAETKYPDCYDISFSHQLVKTKNFSYTVDDLVAIRNFTAHGQAISSDLNQFDYLILEEFPPLLGEAIGRFLDQLSISENLANNLASASIVPYRNRPVFDSLWATDADNLKFTRSIADLINKMDWSYKTQKFR